MLEGLIIEIISNLFYVEVAEEIYTCTSRGKFKIKEQMPVVGDMVKVEVTDKEKKCGTIVEIRERKTYIKRPKIANIEQMILVVSFNYPKPDLLLLDKQLAYLEFLHITPVICFNKLDLGKEQEIEELMQKYQKIGYTVLKTIAKKKEGIFDLMNVLEGKISAFSGNSGVRKININKCNF